MAHVVSRRGPQPGLDRPQTSRGIASPCACAKTKYDVVRADMKKVRKTNVEYQRQLRELQKVRAKQDEDYAELLSK